jgi:hypothetical protein
MSSSPAYLDACHDAELVGPPLGLYLRLYHDYLDAWEFRAVKQIVLASEMRCSERTIERGVALLVKRGYLEQAKRGFGEVGRYRLVHSRMRELTAD